MLVFMLGEMTYLFGFVLVFLVYWCIGLDVPCTNGQAKLVFIEARMIKSIV